MPRVLTALGLLALALVATAAESDWPTFRGPDRTDVSKDKNLLAKWPEDGPPLAWKTTGLGVGFSSVSVMGDKVYTMGDVEKSSLLFAVDRAKGGKLWELKVGPNGGGGGYIGPRCTPSTDGEFVYALGWAGDLVCATTKDGKEVWRKNFKTDLKGRSGGWSYTESPLIDGEHLIVTPGGPDAAVAALDKKSGKVVWTGSVPGGDSAGYASLVIAELGGVKQYVTLMANGLVSFAAKDGKMLWRYGTSKDRFGSNTANIPTPIVKDEYVFAAAGYGRGAALLKVTKDGGEFAVEEVYWNKDLTNKHGGVVLVGDRLFGDRDDSGNLQCSDFKTGKVLWSRRGGKGPKGTPGEGGGSASLTYADGKLYVRYSDGWVHLVDATADKYTMLSEFKVPNGKNNTWAHPVVVGGKLYIRELDVLYCHDVSAK
jgi:outer membrane protein assembly factor BamB